MQTVEVPQIVERMVKRTIAKVSWVPTVGQAPALSILWAYFL